MDDAAVREAGQRALADGSWGKYHGPYCTNLAAALADYHGCEHAVLCSSGTAAIELALRGLKVGEGDEVVLAAYDFQGNFRNIVTVGATPVLVDVDRANWNLDPSALADAISSRTRAVVVSHLHGGVVPMRQLVEIARERGIAVIEDACQMPGAMVYGRRAGMWGDVGVLSFGGSKLLTAGRGGALITNSPELVQRMRLYSFRGNEAYPLSELQAAVLLPQLEALDERNRRRAATVAAIAETLSVPGLASFRNADSDIEPGYYKLGLQYDPNGFADLARDDFAAGMRAEGIALDPGFRAAHFIHSARRYRKVGELPNADAADRGVLTLHHPVLIEGPEAAREVVEAVEKIARHAAELREHFASQPRSAEDDDAQV